jgi:hypothetical protein
MWSPMCSTSPSAHDEVEALVRQAILSKFVSRSVRDHLASLVHSRELIYPDGGGISLMARSVQTR